MTTSVAYTGKQFTFTLGSLDGSAQVTSIKIDEKASSDSIQFLSGSVAISKGVETTISVDLAYDGGASGTTGLYAALQASLATGAAGTVSVDGPATDSWDGSAIVTSLSAEIPADGAVTCSAELTVSGALTYTPVGP